MMKLDTIIVEVKLERGLKIEIVFYDNCIVWDGGTVSLTETIDFSKILLVQKISTMQILSCIKF